MTDAPGYSIRCKGLDLNRAPRNLWPYLDSCDGAIAVGGIMGAVDGKPAQTHTIWALLRDGDEVGRVTIEGPPAVTPHRTDLAEAKRRAYGLISTRARRLAGEKAARRALWVKVLVVSNLILAALALLAGLFELGRLYG